MSDMVSDMLAGLVVGLLLGVAIGAYVFTPSIAEQITWRTSFDSCEYAGYGHYDCVNETHRCEILDAGNWNFDLIECQERNTVKPC